MLPFPGALMEQPAGVIQRFEIIMKIRDEEEERAASKMNQEPPPK